MCLLPLGDFSETPKNFLTASNKSNVYRKIDINQKIKVMLIVLASSSVVSSKC